MTDWQTILVILALLPAYMVLEAFVLAWLVAKFMKSFWNPKPKKRWPWG
jgi:hypothetical protein